MEGEQMKVIDYAYRQTRTTRKATILSFLDALIGLLTILAFLTLVYGMMLLLA